MNSLKLYILSYCLTFLTVYSTMANEPENIELNLENSSIKKNLRSLSQPSINEKDIEFYAQNINFDVENQTMIFTGDVTFISNNSQLKADIVFYNSSNDVLYAKGNVVFIDAKGNKITAEEITFDPKINTGLIKDFKTIFNDKSTMIAKSVNKINNDDYQLNNMCFTSCLTISNNIPFWQIKSSKGIYREDIGEITLYNARFEVKNIPVFWTPYFSFSNLDFIRKIGFLTPQFESNSIYGNSIILPFYIPINDHHDILFNTHLFKKFSPLVDMVYNGELKEGSILIDTSFTNEPKNNILLYDRFRWHYFAKYKQNINEIIRAKATIELASDFQYLNMYDINPKKSEESFFINNLVIENFLNNKHYVETSINHYKIINPDFLKNIVTPVNFAEKSKESLDKFYNIHYTALQDYTSLGRLNLNIDSSHFFLKKDNLSRVVVDLNYKYSNSNPFGTYSFDMINNHVLYYTADKNSALPDNYNSNAGASVTWEYPSYYSASSFIYTLTPVVQLSYAKYINNNNNRFLTDSFNANIGVSSLFDINHFSGYDQFEESQDIKYAFEFSLINSAGKGSRFFIGQMFRKAIGNKAIQGNSNNIIASNYFVSLYFYPTSSLSVVYNGTINNSLENLETSIIVQYNNSLINAGISYDEYTTLDRNVFGNDRIAEFNVYNKIKLTPNYRVQYSFLFDVSPSYSATLKTTNVNIGWANECLELIVYMSTNFYTSNDSRSFGVKASFKGLDSYDFKL